MSLSASQPAALKSLTSLLGAGDTLKATVLSRTAPGRFLISVSGQQVSVESRLLLTPGQQLELAVRQSGGKILMDLVGQPAAAPTGRTADAGQAQPRQSVQLQSDSAGRPEGAAQAAPRAAPTAASRTGLPSPAPASPAARSVAAEVRTALVRTPVLGEALDQLRTAVTELTRPSAISSPQRPAQAAPPQSAQSGAAELPSGEQAPSTPTPRAPVGSGAQRPTDATLPVRPQTTEGMPAPAQRLSLEGQPRQAEAAYILRPPAEQPAQAGGRPPVSDTGTSSSTATAAAQQQGDLPRQIAEIVRAVLLLFPDMADAGLPPAATAGSAPATDAPAAAPAEAAAGQQPSPAPTQTPAPAQQPAAAEQPAQPAAPASAPAAATGAVLSGQLRELPAVIVQLLALVESAVETELLSMPQVGALARVIAELEMLQQIPRPEGSQPAVPAVPVPQAGASPSASAFTSSPPVAPAQAAPAPAMPELAQLLDRVMEAASGASSRSARDPGLPAAIREELRALPREQLAALQEMASVRERSLLQSSPRLAALGGAHRALLDVQGRVALGRSAGMALSSPATSFDYFEIPLPGRPGQSGRLRVVVGQRGRGETGRADRISRAILDLNMSALGDVWTELVLHGNDLRVRMQLPDAERRDHVAGEVPELTASLAAAGLQASVLVETRPVSAAERRDDELWPEDTRAGELDLWA